MQDFAFYLQSFRSNQQSFKGLFSNIPDEQIRWKPEPEKWNLLEVVCHLYDEEREDFRTRLQSVLADPSMAFPGINPPGWVVERNYAGQDFYHKVLDFLEEREKTIQWLKSLDHAPWQNTYQHPSLGPMSAGFILANWLAHDYIHIRQITRLKYQYLSAHAGQDLSYAGNW